MLDRASFFDNIRSSPFPGHLTEDQVRGMDELLDVWERVGWKNTWYPSVNLANVYRETGGMMVPVREGFAKTDAEARRIVAHRPYSGIVNGHVYYGRGRIQNTWDYNYKKLSQRFGYDFYNDPDAILNDSKRDAEITVHGHLEGIWTGKKLSDYLDQMPPDLFNSRRCVNGTDHAQEIADNAAKFERAIRLARSRDVASAPLGPVVVPQPPGAPTAPPVVAQAEPTFWEKFKKVFTG